MRQTGRSRSRFGAGARHAVATIPFVCGWLAAQSGTPPKHAVQDYPAHTESDKISIGAEYLVHSFSGGGELYIAKDYLVVEVALFLPRAKP